MSIKENELSRQKRECAERLKGQQAAEKNMGHVLLELRQSAMDQLGDLYDIKEFHNVVLTSGAVPLDILGLIVQFSPHLSIFSMMK